ncbi:Glu/Leu/Phe/Val dehydrogenase family, partial [Phytophthora palmivora]
MADPANVSTLIDHGASVDLSDKYWSTPSIVAAESKYADVVELLLRAGASLFEGIQRKLQLQAPITKVQTGGPDGDLGSNEIKMSPQEETIAVVDGSGVLYDPKGMNRENLVKLVVTYRQGTFKRCPNRK